MLEMGDFQVYMSNRNIKRKTMEEVQNKNLNELFNEDSFDSNAPKGEIYMGRFTEESKIILSKRIKK